MKITSTKLIAVAAAILMASASAFAAVKNGASLKGTDYTKGGNNAKGGGVIAWNSFSSVDPTAFSHNLSSGDLTVLKDGDYLVAFTVPLTTINSQRNTHRAELLVNGDAVSTAVGESSYIRFASNHSEASDHFAGLVGLKANDVLTVKTTPTAQTGGNSFIATCSLYAELVEGDRNVFSASATEIQSGVELNVEPDIGDQGLVWTSTRKGSGYTHSDGEAGITIKDDGNYMVYANVPLRGNVQRASVGLTINLDDEYIWGARGQQGYIRNANSHQDASIHFSGMIRAEAGQVLTVTTEQLANVGSIKVQADRAASIFIEKVRNDGIFSDSFTDTTAGEDLNPVNKTALSLVGDGESLDIIDNLAYSNDGDNEENIVIKKAGSYLLSFNSTFTGGSLRANPRVTVEINGSVVPGATSTAHYNRHADGHDETTGSFVALLSDLAVDDVVTVSVQREGNGGVVTSPEGGRVVLQAKATYEPAAGDQFPPRFSSFSGGLDGFSATLDDGGLKLDAATLKATLNGEVVAVTVDSANGVHAISYAFPTFPATGSEHALNIAFNDTGGNANSMDFAFTVNTQYKTISPAVSMSDVNKDKGGFRVNLSQISAIQTEGPTQIHGNSWINAEKQIRGEFLNPNEVDDDDNPLPYLNEADPDAWEGWSITPADVDYVNMNQDEDGNIGNFGEDQTLPNIPGWGDSTDGIAGEFLTVLHLKKGFQTLGVNSDDGFRATVGLNFHDMEAQQIGLFDGGRGAADSLFNIVATEEGYYPLRVLWWEGGGGANIEIFSIVDGEKVLVNDPDNADAIKAYNIGNSTGRTYFGSVSPSPDDTFTTENSISATIIEDGTKAKSGSIKVLLNGVEVDASIKSADGVATVTAEPDGGLGIGSHTAKIVFTETTDPETERSFEWSFEVTAFSAKMRELVDGEPNPIAYWDFDFADVPDLTFEHVFNLESVMTNAKYTEDKGGHTGETGDYAMDFLQGAANLLVPDGEFLNIASAFDKISVSLWQKNYTTPNSSSFWGYSPSSNNGFRGIQAHIPWSNLQIFFDTAGCCGGATQRINRAVDADHEWTEWHHYVFVKDKGHKSIWIDGTLFHEGDNSLVLPSDFDFLYIGSNGAGGNSASGIIDDFAVFASALTEEQIIALSEGNTDILPEKREIVVPQPDIPILLSKSPTSAGPVGEDEISIRFRGIDFTGLSITVNDTAVDPTITSDAMFTTITADGAFSLGENVITVSWNGESETWKYFQFTVAEGQTGLASYSVETVGAVPGPWAFEGVWVSEGSVAGCGGPYHDFLTSPNYIVSADGEVTFSFEHRHAFEGAMWDSGQLWISVNGDAYADVGIDAFTANGYTDIAIIGNGIAKGQNGFGNTSAGYADGSYITTTASLGSFDAGDAVSVRFVALYDDCATGTNPNWVIASVSSDQMAIKLIEGGLVAHWPMNEGSGDVFKDVVGGFDGFLPLAQDGAQTEVSWGEGPPTQANSVEFSGANSFIATRFPGIGGSEPRTVAFWVRTTDANAVYMAWGSNATARKWHIRANGASGVMRTEFAGGQNFATTSIIDGEWHHVASVFPNGATEGEQILHYIDGVLDPQAGGTSLTIDTEIVTDADIDWTNANSAESYPVHIGGRLTHGWGNMLIGSMADVRIYNQGLSEDKIRAIFEGKAEGGMNLEGPTIVDFGDLSGDASYEFFFKAIKAGASTAIAGNDAFAFKLDQWNEQGVFGTTVFGVADNLFTAVEGKSVASVFDRDVHVVLVNDTAAGETRLYVDGDHVGVLAGNFELAGEGKVMGARIEANTDPMGDGSVMHKWATYDNALTNEQIAGLADEVAPLPDLVDISAAGDGVVPTSDNHPAGEHAGLAVDDNDQTKYLNFDGANNNASGLTITTSGGVVSGLGLTSANDAPDRDPATFVLSGSNDGGATLTEIASGDVPAFGARFERQEVRFANDAAYTTYELIFPTTAGSSTCCMQIAEIELLGTPTVPIVSNGSFEADDVPEWPGYGAITAWTGGSGINDGGPFGDNGVIPDGAKLGFIQGTKALSQQLTGLEAGAEYVLAFYYNARNCCGGTIGFTVSVGGEELGSVSDVEPVGGENAYNSASYYFVAAGTEAELVFSATAAGDATLLLDAVSVSRAGEGPAETPAPAELPWSVGLNDDGWPAGDGGGPNTTFVQEKGANELPGNPASPEVAQQGDDDYYWAGLYSTVIAGNGDYTPVGLVEANEESAERAFAGIDNDLRYHFNLPESLEPTDRLTVSYDALNLHTGEADSRYGIEVYVNNVQVQSEIVIREAELGQTYATDPFTLADVNAEVGSGYDNILTLKGVNYNAEGGGNWMGIDYVQLSQAGPATPSTILVDFGGTAPNSAGASPGPWVTIDNLVMDQAASLGGGVTITALDDGFNPNNPAQPGEGAEYDGVSVPQEARNDYFFKIADAAGTTARMRIDGLAAGTYNVTVFEGRTTDASQFAKIWTGEEPATENTGDFAKGSATVTVTVGAGESLWYMHLEDGSGGVSGIMIREASDTPALSIVNNGDGSVTVTFEGTLQAANSVNGPWADVEGAVSPQIIPASEAMQYGRAVK